VAIPHIGSFELTRQPAMLDFANRSLQPSSEVIIFNQDDAVSDQQKAFLSELLNLNISEVSQKLEMLGQQLKEVAIKQGFEWRGVGRLEQGPSGLSFNSQFQTKLRPVEAHRVIRENASHAVTIGDKEMQSHEAAELLQEENVRSYLMVIVWILIALALLFIGYLFYSKGFSPLSSGSQDRFGCLHMNLGNLC